MNLEGPIIPGEHSHVGSRLRACRIRLESSCGRCFVFVRKYCIKKYTCAYQGYRKCSGLASACIPLLLALISYHKNSPFRTNSDQGDDIS